MNARARRFPLIDSLRAIAAIMVLCAHAGPPAGAELAGAATRPFVPRLNSSLTIFFVISAFLLYRPFVHHRVLGGQRPELRSYALGRFLRIAPAFWLALTVIALILPRPGVLSGDWWIFYGFGQIYGVHLFGGISATWSLCIEVAFYACLPLFVVAMARVPGRMVVTRLRGELVALGVLAL